MLNFDEDRFLESQRGAVGCAGLLLDAMAERLDQGATNLFFAGAGGAGILMWPAADFLERQSGLATFTENPAELVALGSRHLGPHSVVVIPSRSGDTAESLEVLSYAKAAGASVITLTGTPGSLLAEQADFNYTNPVDDSTSSESFYLQSLLLALAVMQVRAEIEDYQQLVDGLQRMPEIMLEAKRSFDDRAEQIASEVASASYHIITSAGSAWPQALYYGMCVLEEMQWIRTRPVHAAEFFHGPLELVEADVSCILMKGEDRSRPLVERVEQFVNRYSGRVMVLDTALIAAPGVPARLRPMISPVLLATVLERVSAHLEVKRDHPLTTRRYYRSVAY